MAACEANGLAREIGEGAWSDGARRHGLEIEVLRRLARYLDLDYRNHHSERDDVQCKPLGEFRPHFATLFDPFQGLELAGDLE